MNWDELWADFRRSRALRPATFTTIQRSLRQFQAHFPDLERPSQVQREHLWQWQSHLAQSKAEATVCLAVRGLLSLLQWGYHEGHLLVNVAEQVSLRKPPRPLMKVLTEEEVQRLLAAPSLVRRRFIAGRDRAILEVLYGTGMRAGELVSLNLDDVDLSQALVHIRISKSQPRLLPLGQVALNALEQYLRHYRPAILAADEDALWLAMDGKRLTASSVHYQVQHYGQLIGLKGAHPHALRRACATHLLARGASVVHLQKLLGHRDIESVLHYAKLFPVDVQRAHRKTHPRARLQ